MDEAFEQARRRWLEERTLRRAVELREFNRETNDDVKDAVRYLLESAQAAPFVKSFVGAKGRAPREQLAPQTQSDRHAAIRQLKSRLSFYPNNALAQIEISRLYAGVGVTHKAVRHAQFAASLAPSNRFVLRAASRLYIHAKEIDRALFSVRRAPSDDPWIMATRVSVCHIADRVREVPIKRVRELLDADLGPEHKAELAAALATIEIENGSRRRANKLFNLASVAPNENAIAQLQWANECFGVPFDFNLLAKANANEAMTFAAMNEGRWASALASSRLWLADESFSVRPALVGCFAAAEMLEDYLTSLDFARAGLEANPKSVALLNNAAYSCAALGQHELARKYLSRARRADVDNEMDVTLLATEGFGAYRVGDAVRGAARYKEAVEKAAEGKMFPLGQLAFLHWIIAEPGAIWNMPIDEYEKVEQFVRSDGIDESVRVFFEIRVRPIFAAKETTKREFQREFSFPLDRLIG